MEVRKKILDLRVKCVQKYKGVPVKLLIKLIIPSSLTGLIVRVIIVLFFLVIIAAFIPQNMLTSGGSLLLGTLSGTPVPTGTP